MHYSVRYVVSSYSKLTSWSHKEVCMRFFRSLRRQRRQPKPPFYLLELDLPFDEIMADLVYPGPSVVT